MHATPHQVDAVKEVGVAISQHDPAVVENRQKHEAAKHELCCDGSKLAVSKKGAAKDGDDREHESEVAHGWVWLRKNEPEMAEDDREEGVS